MQLPTRYKSEPCLVIFTLHASAVSHMTGIKIELLDRTLKMLIVQTHPVGFGQNICNLIKSNNLLYLKRAEIYLSCL